MPVELPDVSDSSEIAYGLLPIEPYLLWIADGDDHTDSSGVFLGANILLKNPQFSKPDDIAQLVIDGKIELIPGCEWLTEKYRVIPVRLKESSEVFFLYAPDNGEWKLDNTSTLAFNFCDNFRALAPDIPIDQTHLVITSYSDFQSIKGLVWNIDAAWKFLSVFNDINDGAINNLIESTIATLRKLWASDLHIQPWLTYAEMLMRLHGLLQPVPGRSHRISFEVANRIAHVLVQHWWKWLSAGTPQDASFRFVPGNEIKKEDAGLWWTIVTANPKLYQTDHRVSILPAIGGHFASVVRLLMKAESMKTLGELGYESVDPFLEAWTIANGLVFLCGPTWSGKSTTLAAMMSELRDPTKKSITIEDPVEIRLPWMVQSQANIAKGYTMASALKSFLRHDPDRILVAEMRDSETAALWVQAANTWHVVFTTLHANSAAESVRRLFSLWVDPLDVATTVKFIFAQRLVEKLSPSNEFVEYYNGADELGSLFWTSIIGPVYLRRTLEKEWIIGRIPIYERISMTDGLRDLIETKWQDVSTVAIEKIVFDEGDWTPMEIYAFKQVLLGFTPLDSLKRHLNHYRMRKFKDLALAMIEKFAVRELLI